MVPNLGVRSKLIHKDDRREGEEREMSDLTIFLLFTSPLCLGMLGVRSMQELTLDKPLPAMQA